MNPMPPHSIALIDLLFGYSLWIVIAGVSLFYGAKALLSEMTGIRIGSAGGTRLPGEKLAVLTPRERDIVKLIAGGATYGAVADQSLVDEAWAILSNLGVARWLQSSRS